MSTKRRSDNASPQTSPNAQKAIENYRKALLEIRELRNTQQTLIRVLQTEVEVSSDEHCKDRLLPAIARAQQNLKSPRTGESPRDHMLKSASMDSLEPVPLDKLSIPSSALKQRSGSRGQSMMHKRLQSSLDLSSSVESEELQRSSETHLDAEGKSVHGWWSSAPFILIHHIFEAIPFNVKDRTLCALACTCKKWNMLVKLHKAHSHRTKLVLELRSTEISYLNSLRQALVYEKEMKANRIGTVEESHSLFSMIPTILTLNRKFVTEINERLYRWSHKSSIGDLLVSYCKEFRLYKVYSHSYQISNKVVEKMLEDSESKKALEEIQRRLKLHRIDSLLVCPIQRLPRYILLIKEMMKHTPAKHHEHKNLATALETVGMLLKLCEQGVQEYVSSVNVFQVLEEIEDVPDTVRTNRVLNIVEMGFGTWVQKPKRLVPIRFVLFKDFILFAMRITNWQKNSVWKFLFSSNISSVMLRMVDDDGVTQSTSTYFLELSSVKFGSHVLFFSVDTEATKNDLYTQWKKLVSEIAGKEVDTSCENYSELFKKYIPVASSSPISQVIKSGWIEKRKGEKMLSGYKKRFLVAHNGGLSYYTSQHGDLKGFIATDSMVSVETKKDELILNANGSYYHMKSEEIKEWTDTIKHLMKNREVQKHENNVVQIIFGDGTRAIIPLIVDDTAKSVLQRCCNRRNLDASKYEFFLENGFSVSPFAPMAKLRGQTLFIVATKQFDVTGKVLRSNTDGTPAEKQDLRNSLFHSSSSVDLTLSEEEIVTDFSSKKKNSIKSKFARNEAKAKDAVQSPKKPNAVMRTLNLSKLRSNASSEAEQKSPPPKDTEETRSIDALVNPRKRDSNCLLKMYTPDGNSYAKVSVSKLAKGEEIFSAFCRKRSLDPADHVLFDVDNQEYVSSATPAFKLMGKSVRVMDRAVAPVEVLDSSSQDTLDDVYVGSVFTGERGKSPLSKTTDDAEFPSSSSLEWSLTPQNHSPSLLTQSSPDLCIDPELLMKPRQAKKTHPVPPPARTRPQPPPRSNTNPRRRSRTTGSSMNPEKPLFLKK